MQATLDQGLRCPLQRLYDGQVSHFPFLSTFHSTFQFTSSLFYWKFRFPILCVCILLDDLTRPSILLSKTLRLSFDVDKRSVCVHSFVQKNKLLAGCKSNHCLQSLFTFFLIYSVFPFSLSFWVIFAPTFFFVLRYLSKPRPFIHVESPQFIGSLVAFFFWYILRQKK